MTNDQVNDPTKGRWCVAHQQLVYPVEGQYICRGRPDKGDGEHEVPEKAESKKTQPWGC